VIQGSQTSRYRVENGRTCIEVRVKNIKQLFDARDPAPFRERDLDDDFVEYVETSADEIGKKPLTLKLFISEPIHEDLSAQAFQQVVASFFQYRIDMKKLQLRRLFESARVFLVIGFFMLISCLMASELLPQLFEPYETISRISREGLTITGWVAMWKPLETVLFDWWPFRRQIQLYGRIVNIKVVLSS
jgi:hypothetical protein